MNCHGMRSSYSNFGPEVTLAGPSDDAEIFNEDQARFDRSDRFFRNYPYDHFAARLKATMETVPFGKAAIRAIDVPGAFGYSDTGTDDIDAFASDPESYFTDFGGTSAASSIVAGVAALVQRAAKLKRGKSLTGPELKKLLVDTARKVKFPHLSQLAPACKDKVDGWPLEFGESFGAGLVAADRAVNLIMTGNPDTPVS